MPLDEEYEFGRAAVARNLMSQTQLDECIELLVALERGGSRQRLWGIVVRRGYMTREQVQALRDELKRPVQPRRASNVSPDGDEEASGDEEQTWDVPLDAEVEPINDPMADIGISPLKEMQGRKEHVPFKPGELRLRGLEGPVEEELYVLDQETIVIGRDEEADLRITDPSVSRRHAEIAFGEREVIIRDLGSRNGISVNGVQLTESVIRPGETIRIGKCLLLLERES